MLYISKTLNDMQDEICEAARILFPPPPAECKENGNGNNNDNYNDNHNDKEDMSEDEYDTYKPEERICGSFQKNGVCRFGSRCKFTHMNDKIENNTRIEYEEDIDMDQEHIGVDENYINDIDAGEYMDLSILSNTNSNEAGHMNDDNKVLPDGNCLAFSRYRYGMVTKELSMKERKAMVKLTVEN
eukprot:92028_1